MPDRDEVDEEDVRGPGELDARLASSSESRACGWRLEYGRDIVLFGSCYCVRILFAMGSGFVVVRLTDLVRHLQGHHGRERVYNCKVVGAKEYMYSEARNMKNRAGVMLAGCNARNQVVVVSLSFGGGFVVSNWCTVHFGASKILSPASPTLNLEHEHQGSITLPRTDNEAVAIAHNEAATWYTGPLARKHAGRGLGLRVGPTCWTVANACSRCLSVERPFNPLNSICRNLIGDGNDNGRYRGCRKNGKSFHLSLAKMKKTLLRGKRRCTSCQCFHTRQETSTLAIYEFTPSPML